MRGSILTPMDPSGLLTGLGWVAFGWVVAAIGATVGVAAFFKAAHQHEQALPVDEASIRAWVHPESEAGDSSKPSTPSRAA